MAKFTKSRARKPLGEGAIQCVYSRPFDDKRDCKIKMQLRIGETIEGNGTYLSLEMTDAELDAVVEFRNRVRNER